MAFTHRSHLMRPQPLAVSLTVPWRGSSVVSSVVDVEEDVALGEEGG